VPTTAHTKPIAAQRFTRGGVPAYYFGQQKQRQLAFFTYSRYVARRFGPILATVVGRQRFSLLPTPSTPLERNVFGMKQVVVPWNQAKHSGKWDAMPRKPKSAALKLVEGRSPGRDSGGRKIAPPPRPVFTAPVMTPGLPTPVRRQWRRAVGELVDRDLPMPPPAVLAGYARTLTRQSEVAAALESAEIGTTTWRRLVATEGELAKQVAAFWREHLSEAAAPVFVADVAYDPTNPFAWADRADGDE
jgi:hypothetical protein